MVPDSTHFAGLIVTMNKHLDRETQDKYEVVVEAEDAQGRRGESGTATVLITLQDVNDNFPIFTQSEPPSLGPGGGRGRLSGRSLVSIYLSLHPRVSLHQRRLPSAPRLCTHSQGCTLGLPACPLGPAAAHTPLLGPMCPESHYQTGPVSPSSHELRKTHELGSRGSAECQSQGWALTHPRTDSPHRKMSNKSSSHALGRLGRKVR